VARSGEERTGHEEELGIVDPLQDPSKYVACCAWPIAVVEISVTSQ